MIMFFLLLSMLLCTQMLACTMHVHANARVRNAWACALSSCSDIVPIAASRAVILIVQYQSSQYIIVVAVVVIVVLIIVVVVLLVFNVCSI